MKSNQMIFLFFCNFAVFFTGGALLPLLPLYATELGGTPTIVGLYLAAFFSTTVVYTGRLGASLSMHLLEFSPQAVAAAAIGSLVTTPIPLIILSWLNAMTWLGGVLGFAGGGYALDRLGVTPLFFIAVALAVAAAAMVGGFSGQLPAGWPKPAQWKSSDAMPSPKKV